MKLLRWTIAGASFYVIYKYSIGKKAKGKDVFVSPEKDEAGAAQGGAVPEQAAAERPKRTRGGAAKRPRK